jgi:hypothetical protein
LWKSKLFLIKKRTKLNSLNFLGAARRPDDNPNNPYLFGSQRPDQNPDNPFPFASGQRPDPSFGRGPNIRFDPFGPGGINGSFGSYDRNGFI